MRFQAKTFLHGVLVMFAFGALGQSGRANDLSGIYFGGNAGTAQIDYDNALYQKQLEGQVTGIGSLDFTDSSLRKRNAAWWVDAGYMLSPYFGIEADYLHFGALYNRVNGKYTPNGGIAESVILATLVRSDGPALGLLLRLPLTDAFALNLRLADYYGRTTLVNTIDATTDSSSRETANNSSLLLGLGAAYTFDGHWSAHLDYQRVNQAGNSSSVVKYDADMATIGLSYTF
ncbi:MAG: outer membrane beta-barrel protein [Steroidobacteraceae bacterium]|jgi:opacity protein-like surface antigen